MTAQEDWRSMPNLHDLLQQYLVDQFLPGYVALFFCAIAAGLALLLLTEAVSLLSKAHRIGRWRWRQWIGVVLLLSSGGNLALTYIFGKLSSFFGLNPPIRRCFPPCDLPPDPATLQALRTLSRLAEPSVVWLLATYGVTLVGLIALGIRTHLRTVNALSAE